MILFSYLSHIHRTIYRPLWDCYDKIHLLNKYIYYYFKNTYDCKGLCWEFRVNNFDHIKWSVRFTPFYHSICSKNNVYTYYATHNETSLLHYYYDSSKNHLLPHWSTVVYIYHFTTWLISNQCSYSIFLKTDHLIRDWLVLPQQKSNFFMSCFKF